MMSLNVVKGALASLLAGGLVACGAGGATPARSPAPARVASSVPAGALWHPRQLGTWTPPKAVIPAKHPTVSPKTTAVVHTPTKPATTPMPSHTVAPAAPSAPPGPLAMRDVKVADPVIAYPTGTDEPYTGFTTTINTTTGTAAVGPGWELKNGQYVKIFSGGTINIPSSISAQANVAPYWPEILVTGLPQNPTLEVTTPEQSNCSPTATCHETLGPGPGILLASVGEAFGFPTWTANGQEENHSVYFSTPTWETVDYELNGVVWSGGTFGAGTPTAPKNLQP